MSTARTEDTATTAAASDLISLHSRATDSETRQRTALRIDIERVSRVRTIGIGARRSHVVAFSRDDDATTVAEDATNCLCPVIELSSRAAET